jgi:hypothetical protein
MADYIVRQMKRRRAMLKGSKEPLISYAFTPTVVLHVTAHQLHCFYQFQRLPDRYGTQAESATADDIPRQESSTAVYETVTGCRELFDTHADNYYLLAAAGW